MIFQSAKRVAGGLGGLRCYSTLISKPVYSFGCGVGGKLGNGLDYGYESYPYAVELNGEDVRSVHTGHYHSMLLMESGAVKVCGWNSFVGSEREVRESSYSGASTPTLITELRDYRITSMACGRRHTLLIDDEHRVFAFGVGSEYQLGTGRVENEIIPVQVEALSRLKSVVKVAAGWGHSLALTGDGQVLTWGWTADSQTGQGKSEAPIQEPTFLKMQRKIVNIFPGGDHSMLVDDQGHLYSFGYGAHGQLGHGDLESKERPKLIEFFEPHQFSLCDYKNGSERVSLGFGHSLVIDDNGQAFSFGWNSNGQLGHGQDWATVLNQTTPKPITALSSARSVAAGRSHSAVVDLKNQLFTFGNANKGKLGNGTNKGDQHSPVLIDSSFFLDEAFSSEVSVKQISLGFDHALLQLSNKEN